LQPPANRVTEGVHAEALLHDVLPAHAAASGKALLPFFPPGVVNRVIAAGLPTFTQHTITSLDVLRQRLSAIRLPQIATSRNEFDCGKAAIAMPLFYGAGHVAAAIELTVGDLGSESQPATGALSVACRSLSRQLATQFRVRGNRNGQPGSHAYQRNSRRPPGLADLGREISAGRPQHLDHPPTVLGDHLRRGPVAALPAVGLRLADPIP
jgi:hypothetical protein